MLTHTRLMANIVSHKITLISKEQIANNTFAFTFTKPSDFQYSAGQHARLTVLHAGSDTRESLSRFLSFASAPHEPDLIFAVRMSDTLFKQTLLGMKTGEQILLQTRQGHHRRSFSWSHHADINQTTVFIAGGIGVVPALSMIKEAIERRLPTPIYLFYANRHPEDAPYLSELERMSMERPAFTCIPTITKLSSSDKWQGETGYICRNMIQAYVPNPANAIYYIAGKSGMTMAMREMVRGFGVAKSNIRVEDFDGKMMRRMASLQHRRGLTSYLKPARLGILIGVAAALHILFAVALRHKILQLHSLGSPDLYLTIGLVLAVIGIKISLVLRRQHRKN